MILLWCGSRDQLAYDHGTPSSSAMSYAEIQILPLSQAFQPVYEVPRLKL